MFLKSLWGYHAAHSPTQFSAPLTVRKLFLLFDPHSSCCCLNPLFPGLAILGMVNRLFPFSSWQPLCHWWLLCFLNCFCPLCLNLQLPYCSLIDPDLWPLTVHIFSSGNSGVVPLFFFSSFFEVHCPKLDETGFTDTDREREICCLQLELMTFPSSTNTCNKVILTRTEIVGILFSSYGNLDLSDAF